LERRIIAVRAVSGRRYAGTRRIVLFAAGITMRDYLYHRGMSGRPGPAVCRSQSQLAESGLPDPARRRPSGARGTGRWTLLLRTLATTPAPAAERFTRIAVNLAGAAIAAWFAQASVRFYLDTHRLIGGLFVIEQMWFAIAFLIRRPPRAVSRRIGTWLAAFGGTFGGLLLRPAGAHPPWGVHAGFGVQLAGLLLAIASLLALGRSFGFVAADRGLKTRGPYGVVRHPIYASYLLIQSGYLLQSLSLRNLAVVAFATACNIARALAEERLLARSPAYRAYRERVRWRLIPYLW
jgi:protein-S-isoprenylcysteine O-methyltransferase Ste14